MVVGRFVVSFGNDVTCRHVGVYLRSLASSLGLILVRVNRGRRPCLFVACHPLRDPFRCLLINVVVGRSRVLCRVFRSLDGHVGR